MTKITTTLLAAALLVGGAAALHAAAADTVLTPYLKMQEALAADSTDGVVSAAGKIAAAAKHAAHHGGARGEALAAVGAAAAQLEGSDLAALRESFKGLSEAMIAYVAVAGAEGTAVYHCPMAKARWVQAEGEVRNPYHGKSMLRCGTRVKAPEAE
jgi:hypothetical protein